MLLANIYDNQGYMKLLKGEAAKHINYWFLICKLRLFWRNNFGLFIHLALKGWLSLSEHKRELKEVKDMGMG